MEGPVGCKRSWGRFDFTERARAGSLSCRVKEATAGVATVGEVQLELVRSTKIPAGLHAAEASYVSSSSLSAFRADFVRAVWSSKMPLANTPAILNLLDGPIGVDPALHIVLVMLNMNCPDEEPGISRMLDLISSWPLVMAWSCSFLLISAAELGFAWDGDEKGWVRPSLISLRMMAGPIQNFYSSILDAWRKSVFVNLSEREGFRGKDPASYLSSTYESRRKRIRTAQPLRIKWKKMGLSLLTEKCRQNLDDYELGYL